MVSTSQYSSTAADDSPVCDGWIGAPSMYIRTLATAVSSVAWTWTWMVPVTDSIEAGETMVTTGSRPPPAPLATTVSMLAEPAVPSASVALA